MEEQYDAIKVGQRIKDTRLKKGLTQAQLSDKTGISITQLSAYENGNKHAGLQSLNKIALATDSLIDVLLNGDLSNRPICKSINKGELIVNCVEALHKEGILGFTCEEVYDPSLRDYVTKSNLAFINYAYIIEDLIEKLNELRAEKENYPDPESFKEQILASAVHKINKRK